MAQKINASALRVGNTQLWKFETNPNFYTSSNINYLFVYLFIKSELKKYKSSIVDIKKTDNRHITELNIFLFIEKKEKLSKVKFKFFKNKFKKIPSRKNLKKFKFQLKEAFLKSQSNFNLLKDYSSITNRLQNPTKSGFCIFQLKQNSLKEKIKFNGYSNMWNILLIKNQNRKISHVKITKFIKLHKMACNLELKINKIFKINTRVNLKDALNYLSVKSTRTSKRLEKKLSKFRNLSFFQEIIQIIGVAFEFKSSQLLADYIAEKINVQKRINSFIKPLEYILKQNFIIRKNLFALKLEIWGKRFKSGRTRKTRIVCGPLKTSTISYPAYESIAHAFTRFGTFGIKLIFIQKINDK